MTVDRNRIDRGKASQLIVAAYFAGHGWPYAEPVGSGRAGTDVTGMPGLLIEVKAERGWRPTTWLNQHQANGHQVIAVQRPDGYGPERIGAWPAIMRLDSLTALLHAAGYGTGEGSCEPPSSTAIG